MNFLYPQLLFGLFALAIPIIIHLFNFRRTKKIYFSNTRFLKKVKDASSSKLKLKHYLILAARLLTIFFMVVAFAQPYVTSEGNRTTQDEVVIYLDNSASMSNEMSNGMSAFDAAISYVNKLLEVYPEGTSYQLLTNEFESFSTSFKSRDEIADYLTTLNLSGKARDFAEIGSRVNNSTIQDSLDFYWISDFQKSTTGTEAITLDSLVGLNLVPLQYQTPNNVFIDSIYLENPFMLGNEQLTLNVKVVNTGVEDVNQLGIKVFLDELQVATAIMDINALSSQIISFNISYDVQNQNKGRVSIEEYPVTFDNDFYFVINKKHKVNVLEIKSATSGAYISNVFGNKELFQLASFEAANVDYSLIEKSDLVVLNGLEQISSALMRSLKARINNNGKILLIPGDEVNLTDYQLLMPSLKASENKSEINLAAPDFNDPFFANIFEERNNRFAMPSATSILDLGIDRTAILKFQNGKPFLRYQNNLFIIAASLNPEISTFQNHALFVPVMYNIATSSISSLDRLYHDIDDRFITLKVDTILTDDVFKLRNDRTELIPAQRMSAGNMVLELPNQNIDEGFYELMLKEKNVTTLAINNSTVESRLEQLSLDELNDYFKGRYDVINADDELAFAEIVKNKYQGQPLWKWAIALSLLFLLFEALLIRFFP